MLLLLRFTSHCDLRTVQLQLCRISWSPILGFPSATFGLTRNRFLVTLQLHGEICGPSCLHRRDSRRGLALASPPLAILLALTLSESVRLNEIYWFAVADVTNDDPPACVGGSGSCIISFRLDAADQSHFY